MHAFFIEMASCCILLQLSVFHSISFGDLSILITHGCNLFLLMALKVLHILFMNTCIWIFNFFAVLNSIKIDMLVLRTTTLHSSGKFHSHPSVRVFWSCAVHSLRWCAWPCLGHLHSFNDTYWVSSECRARTLLVLLMYLVIWKVLKWTVLTILIFQLGKWRGMQSVG